MSTGDGLELICQAGTGSNQSTKFDVVWRLNGTVMINSSYLETSYSDNTHYLRVDPVFSSDSGTYSCELDGDATVKASLSITVNPGMNGWVMNGYLASNTDEEKYCPCFTPFNSH